MKYFAFGFVIWIFFILLIGIICESRTTTPVITFNGGVMDENETGIIEVLRWLKERNIQYVITAIENSEIGASVTADADDLSNAIVLLGKRIKEFNIGGRR